MLFNIEIKHYTYIYYRLIVRISHIMEIGRMSNQAILVMLGERFLQVRLNEGLEQIELAEKAGVNVSTVQSLENGKRSVGLEKIIAILRALDKLHELDNFMPKPPVRSASLLTNKNQVRKRVSKRKEDKQDTEPFQWNKSIAASGD